MNGKLGSTIGSTDGCTTSIQVNVGEGERVRAGDPLIDGPIDPHDVLAVLGIRELQRYLVDKIQEVYRSQSVAIKVRSWGRSKLGSEVGVVSGKLT
ncbi:MAG: DNA-directed polymerase subunit beta [Thermoanaerobaculia bacterium]|jgi:hypothetical protein|nr:DNA-directed polymerase subunit beta [Thermoanaerobaculia bacterium]